MLLFVALLAGGPAVAAISCQRNVSAELVVIDKPIMFNRLGAGNINGVMYALRRDVINNGSLRPLTAGGAPVAGQLDLRPDKRPRPLVLRVRRGDCLTVTLTNLLTTVANPNQVVNGASDLVTAAGQSFGVQIDEQVADRAVSFHASGMQVMGSIDNDGSAAGLNADAFVQPGQSRSYTVYAEREGVFNVTGSASFGSDGNQGNTSNGLFGQLIVEPAGARIYRSQVFEEELRLATTGTTRQGQPIINYEARYPTGEPWASEGKAGLPVLNMMQCASSTSCTIVHSEINAVVAGPNADGSFPPGTYPLESVGKRNPTVPNRLEPFRDFASVFHDETASGQAFPGFFVQDPVFRYVLAGVKDAFMINYGSGGIGSEIIANRLGVGPMHDCLDCAYEEFFLTSFAVGDPALTVDVPANLGLETLLPGQAPPPGTTGPKANYVIGAEDPSNVHHSYIGDFVKFRNSHIGKEQHVFHLHNHQWLFNPNDDNSNYLDAQGIGPGVGYTYEINFGGSGNRNKSAGDAIFHCHFYPHFAQGMWYHWRNHDVFEPGTILKATPSGTDARGYALAGGYHATPWALAEGMPATGARAYPDGEIAAGTPIPALVPLPGKPMPLMPGRVTTEANTLKSVADPTKPVGSLARVIDRTVNPGYPFWVAGIEDVIGQRPPTPLLDMLTRQQAEAMKQSGDPLWAEIEPAQADGFDGGLPRHALKGVAVGGEAHSVVSRLDFSKEVVRAGVVYYPETGTDLERVAMAFHAQRCVDTSKPDGSAAACSVDPTRGAVGGFILNGSKPVVGAPYHNPCIDDTGTVLKGGVVGRFFSGELATAQQAALNTRGASFFHSDNPRIYKGTNLQFDAVFNKAGYHYPQERIVALWQDVEPVITKQKAPEPLVMRMNTFDCTLYHHSNLVPSNYEIDDYQVRTPTDIIGQHIHLPKWDLTTTDGSANGWNYEDGTLSPGAVQERIRAIREFNLCAPEDGPTDADRSNPRCPVAAPHPYWGKVAGRLGADFQTQWLGARTTTQRWFADPVVNTDGVDRGLGIIFTHDHYGPSTHQQIGLYSTVLTEPAGSRWAHNETGAPLGYDPMSGVPARTDTRADGSVFSDGGPTSWQAAILPQAQSGAYGGNTVKAEGCSSTTQVTGVDCQHAFREFYFEFSDFQHAYEPGVYAGADQHGLPLPGTGPGQSPKAMNAGNPEFAGADPAQSFRFAINPPAREQITPVFPDLVLELASTQGAAPAGNFCPTRPCPQAISVQDPGMLVSNYRNEPVGLRVFDPEKVATDGKRGMQASGDAGDLAHALQTRTDRALAAMNVQPDERTVIHGTRFPPQLNASGPTAGDPYTPMLRTYSGDLVRVKIQAGGHEEEHNATIHGLKWLQAGSGHGRAQNSGWRNGQAAGISEQFTLSAPVMADMGAGLRAADYAWSVDAANDGWWSGMWGLMRNHTLPQADLFHLPGKKPQLPLNTLAYTLPLAEIAQQGALIGVCPRTAPRRSYDVSAVLANTALGNSLHLTIPTTGDVATLHAGGPLKADGGTLVYNHRDAVVSGSTIDDQTGQLTSVSHSGGLHDPTAILYVMSADLDASGRLKPGVPVEPLVLRAAAGDCINVTLRNRLPAVMPDLATYATLIGVVKRDRHGAEGSTTFNTNHLRPSSKVGLHPQLVEYDVTRNDGANVGRNPVQTVAPGGSRVYQWYAGDLSMGAVQTNAADPKVDLVTINATPVEFGGINLTPADRIKQGAKSLVGAMVVEPKGATWKEDTQVLDHQSGSGTRATRAQATVCPGGGSACSISAANAFRDFSLVLTKGNTHYYRDGSPVEHMNGEGVGIPEDSQESSGMLLNYGIEPMWLRFGILPQAPFGPAATPGSYAAVPNAHRAYSNSLVVAGGAAAGDPATPVFKATAGKPARVRLTNPHGTTRGSTFQMHGHVWQRDPYTCAGDARNGLTGACKMTGVGSRNIGTNPLGFYTGGQESWTPYSHFDLLFPSAGGGNGVPGDYLFRDAASFGNASGLWGLMRVQ